MTYMSVVLLLSGYQADEQRMLKGYEEIISKYGLHMLWKSDLMKLHSVSSINTHLELCGFSTA